MVQFTFYVSKSQKDHKSSCHITKVVVHGGKGGAEIRRPPTISCKIKHVCDRKFCTFMLVR
jgi:hypothetical protein